MGTPKKGTGKPPKKKSKTAPAPLSTNSTPQKWKDLKSTNAELKRQVKKMKQELLSKTKKDLSKSSSTHRNELPPDLKTAVKDAIFDVVWAKSPILNSEADRDKFAQDIAIHCGLPKFALDKED